MAVKIRFTRIGKKHAPVYRIVATDSRKKRDGKYIENLGTYNPLTREIIQWHQERITYWVGQGAQLTDVVKRLQKIVNKQAATNKKEDPQATGKVVEVGVVEEEKKAATKTTTKKTTTAKKAEPKKAAAVKEEK